MTKYKETRDFPSVRGPSYLSVHLRFGTVSIRALAQAAFDGMHKAMWARAPGWAS